MPLLLNRPNICPGFPSEIFTLSYPCETTTQLITAYGRLMPPPIKMKRDTNLIRLHDGDQVMQWYFHSSYIGSIPALYPMIGDTAP